MPFPAAEQDQWVSSFHPPCEFPFLDVDSFLEKIRGQVWSWRQELTFSVQDSGVCFTVIVEIWLQEVLIASLVWPSAWKSLRISSWWPCSWCSLALPWEWPSWPGLQGFLCLPLSGWQQAFGQLIDSCKFDNHNGFNHSSVRATDN